MDCRQFRERPTTDHRMLLGERRLCIQFQTERLLVAGMGRSRSRQLWVESCYQPVIIRLDEAAPKAQ
jgi:hypothetical protein